MENKELKLFEEKQSPILTAIVNITKQKEELDKQEKIMKEKLLQVMEREGIKSFENERIKITFVPETTRESFDSKKMKEEHPTIASHYIKTSKVSASIRIKVK